MPVALKKILRDYGPYVEELRRRVMVLVALFIGLFVLGFLLAPNVIRLFVQHFRVEGVSYVVSSPFQAFSLSINIGLSAAFIGFLPLLLLQFYGYVAPALTKKERKVLLGYAAASIGLFITGFAYGVAVLEYAVALVVRLNEGLGLQNLWDVSTFFSQVLLTSVFLGLLFQLPLILHAALRQGFLTHEMLARQRRVVIALCVIIVALLPPTDGLSLIVMALPLIGLFELVLILEKYGHRSAREARKLYTELT